MIDGKAGSEIAARAFTPPGWKPQMPAVADGRNLPARRHPADFMAFLLLAEKSSNQNLVLQRRELESVMS